MERASFYENLKGDHPYVLWWAGVKLEISEFFWRFHPRRNRFCRKCGDFIGNSSREARSHECSVLSAS